MYNLELKTCNFVFALFKTSTIQLSLALKKDPQQMAALIARPHLSSSAETWTRDSTGKH